LEKNVKTVFEIFAISIFVYFLTLFENISIKKKLVFFGGNFGRILLYFADGHFEKKNF
jgi:hypothetical protein